jgi:hypothetical protein
MIVVRADGFVDPCIPTLAAKPPAGPGWVHEIKHDGYRLILRRDGEMVRLFTRRGYDWTEHYPAIASAAAKLRAKSFTLDGEAVVAGADGVAIFDALHRRGRVIDAILQAFDLLELDGEDLRPLPLRQRKPRLARLSARARAGIALYESAGRRSIAYWGLADGRAPGETLPDDTRFAAHEKTPVAFEKTSQQGQNRSDSRSPAATCRALGAHRVKPCALRLAPSPKPGRA